MSAGKRNRKSNLSKILTMIGIVVSVLLLIIIITLLTKKPVNLEISDVDITTISDGAYTGKADNGMVKATVSVEVKNGKIHNITILEHDNLLGKKAEKIVDSITAQQSLEVDAVTSATYSSQTIKKAVENALRQGE